MKALILDSKVIDTSNNEFEVHSSMTWMDAPDGCVAGWELSDGSLVAPSGPTNDEIAANNRMIRNNLLFQTDFYALIDVTMSDAMKAYRQALRDLPDHSNWPNLKDADWPTKP